MYIGDFNGDGRTDRFVYNLGNGQNWVELANGSAANPGTTAHHYSPGLTRRTAI